MKRGEGMGAEREKKKMYEKRVLLRVSVSVGETLVASRHTAGVKRPEDQKRDRVLSA